MHFKNCCLSFPFSCRLYLQNACAFTYVTSSLAKRKEDTAVDEGGPTRQFLTDVFKQLDILCIKVGEGEVELFENTPGGVQVQTDDPLNSKIQALLKRSSDTHEDTVENAIKRAKDYVRAIGRIILHAIVHKQTLPSNAIPAFFMNGKVYFCLTCINHSNLSHLCLYYILMDSDVSWI